MEINYEVEFINPIWKQSEYATLGVTEIFSFLLKMAVKVKQHFFNLGLIITNTVLKIGLILSIFKLHLKHSTILWHGTNHDNQSYNIFFKHTHAQHFI